MLDGVDWILSLALHAVDLLVLVVYLVAVVLLGVWLGRGQKQLGDYLLGGRNLPWWAILGSIVATETSTATFLSVPGIAYGGDLRFLQLAIGYMLGRLAVVYLLLPHYFRGDLMTAYQVLDQRFGGATKRLASLIFLVTRNLGDGLRLFLAGLVLEKILGLSLPTCIVLIGVATIGYTFFGGIKSVVWNDCVQFVIYMAGAGIAAIVVLSRLDEAGGDVVHYALSHDKLRVFDLSFDLSKPYTLWAGIAGGMFLSLGTHGTDQMVVQRYLCSRSQRDAARALIFSGIVVFVQFAIFLLLGVALAAYYDYFPPAEAFANGDDVFATFIVNGLPVGTGVIGLTLAAVFAAAMSTLSSSLNSSASSAMGDLYLPLRSSPGTPEQQLRMSRWMTIGFGLLQILIGIGGIYMASSVVSDVLAIASFAAGLLLGLFGLGVLTERVGQRAALSGLLVGLVVLLLVKFLTPIAWPWYSLIGSITTFCSGLLFSIVYHPTVGLGSEE